MSRLRMTALAFALVVSASVALPDARADAAGSRPRAGEDTQLAWVSFGDSYAAGEGLPDPTRVDGDQTFALCQRALAGDGNRSTAWGALVAADHADAQHYAFVACTGAITDDLFPNPQIRIQAGQLDQARFFAGTQRFDVVTFSFGGNNVGFADVLYGCIGWSPTGVAMGVGGGAASWALAPWVGCTVSEDEMKTRTDRLTDLGTIGTRPDCSNLGDAASAAGFWDSDDLAAGKVTVPELYDVIGRCVVAPGGVVVVMGYPQLVEESDRWEVREGNRCHRIRRADTGKLRGALAHLNFRLRQAAENADRETPARFVFIDPNQFWEGESFTHTDPSDSDRNNRSKRHALCGGGADWLNGVTVGTDGDGVLRPQRSFHPKQLGHDAMARAARHVSFAPQPVAPVTVEELESLTLPHDLCGGLGLPAGDHTLIDGAYQAPGDPDLFVGTSSQTLGDLDQDGVVDGVFTFGCYNGIADHQDSVAVVRALDRSVEVVSLYLDGESGPTDVSSLAIADGRLVASGSIAIDEPLCCPTGFWKGTFAWTSSGLTLESVQIIDGEARTRQLVDALTRNDRAQLAAMMADGWEDYFDDGIARGVTWAFDGCERPSFGATEECRILGNRTAYFVSWVSEGDEYNPGRFVAEPVIYGD